MSSAAARSSGVKSIRSSTVTPCRSNAGGFGRKRLRRRRLLTGRFRLRHRPIFDRPHGLPGDAVEHEGERLLRQLHDRSDSPAIDGDVRQNRRRGQVVVPQVVTHELVVPHALAGLALDADERVREQVVAGTMSAVHVARRAGERQIRVAELFVDTDERPEIRVPGVLPRVVLPRLDAELSGARNHVEGPAQLSRCGRRSPSRRPGVPSLRGGESLIEAPTMTTSRHTRGAPLHEYGSLSDPSCRLTTPPTPKVEYGWPVFALSAISVSPRCTKMRSSPPSRQYATPRVLVPRNASGPGGGS